MFLDAKLLAEKEEGWKLPPQLYSCWNVRGLYNPMQFVLRLRPDIHTVLNTIEPGIKSSSELSFEHVQAFSTYFHETIHWWQHIGSTFGFVLSLIYPAQAHINHKHLRHLIRDIGPIKSILKYNAISNAHANNIEISNTINRVLNNWHDIEFFRRIAIDPKNATEIINSPYFECVGHSYNMAWSSVLWLLTSTLDNKCSFIPDVRKWEEQFNLLKENKVMGYYYGSDVILSPIGAREIFEGQARFSQLQYLYFASDKKMNWDDFENVGMLTKMYREAFDTFLKLLGSEWPETPDDPLVGLFLLVCDIAINPTEGFPFDIQYFPSFILSVDPGIRFILLCQFVQSKKPSLKDSIHGYTKDEYIEVSEVLCSSISCKTPYSATRKFNEWATMNSNCRELLEGDKDFIFPPENMPVSLLFARLLRFQMDKFKNPEFFCWPGYWSTGERKNGIDLKTAEKLFDNHRAFFCDDVDGDIYPRTFPDKDEATVHKIFNEFYSWNITYELTRQWIVQEGEFNYNISWLTSKYSKSENDAWVCARFKDAYGVDPTLFKII